MAYLIFFYMYGFLLQHDDSSDDPDAVIHSDDDVEAEDEEFADVGMCTCQGITFKGRDHDAPLDAPLKIKKES